MTVYIKTTQGTPAKLDWQATTALLKGDSLTEIDSNVTGDEASQGDTIDSVFDNLLEGLKTSKNLTSLSLDAEQMESAENALEVVKALKENPHNSLRELNLTDQKHTPAFYEAVAELLDTHSAIQNLNISIDQNIKIEELYKSKTYDAAMEKLGAAIEKHPSLTSLTMNYTPCLAMLGGVANNRSLKELFVNYCELSRKYGGSALLDIVSQNTTLTSLSIEGPDILSNELLSKICAAIHPSSALQTVILDAYTITSKTVLANHNNYLDSSLLGLLSTKMMSSVFLRQYQSNLENGLVLMEPTTPAPASSLEAGEASAHTATPAITAALQDHASAAPALEGHASAAPTLGRYTEAVNRERAREGAHPYRREQPPRSAKGMGKH